MVGSLRHLDANFPEGEKQSKGLQKNLLSAEKEASVAPMHVVELGTAHSTFSFLGGFVQGFPQIRSIWSFALSSTYPSLVRGLRLCFRTIAISVEQ